MTEQRPLPRLGLTTFDTLRAEDELEWIDDALILPPDFDLIAGRRSALVYGVAGSGKTALFRALLARLQPAETDTPPTRLVVRWQPRPLEPGVVGDAAARAQLTQVLQICADTLLGYLARHADEYGAAPQDVKKTLVWFLHCYLKRDLITRVAAHTAGSTESGRGLLESIPAWTLDEPYLDLAEPAAVIAEVVKALEAIGLEMVHVLVGPDDIVEPEKVESCLRAFLSSLELFENHQFLYKMIFPDSLGQELATSGSVNRRRVDVYPLTWFPEDLIDIVLRRVSLAAGRQLETLDQLCEDDQLAQWLERTGGDLPRGWLDSVKPLAAHYLRRRRSISTGEWHAVRKASPPPLRVDLDDRTVITGWRRIEDLTDGSWALLEHLYENRNRVCTRRELYYRAYQPLSHMDQTVRVVDEGRKKYDHVLDSAISRLRQEIEPDPFSRSPVYLVTARGKGYKLEHAW